MYGTELIVNGTPVDLKQTYIEPEEETINVYHYFNQVKEIYGIGETYDEAFNGANRENYIEYYKGKLD